MSNSNLNQNLNQYSDSRNNFGGIFDNRNSFNSFQNQPTNAQESAFINHNSQSQKKASPEQLKEIRDVFETFDINGDKQIDAQQLRVAMRALGFKVEKRDVLAIMQNYNQHSLPLNKKTMDIDSFEHLMIEKILNRDPEVEFIEAFKLFDVEGTGKITANSLAHVARELGENITQEELSAMIDEFDFDQDGGINFDEFRSIMNN